MGERQRVVVITGSTRGIGFGLAREFLARGHRVVVSGRTAAAVETALVALAPAGGEVHGVPCDVKDYAAVKALWDAAVARFGRVDLWINNAGISQIRLAFDKLPVAQIAEVVGVNLLGVMHGSQVALTGMTAQGGGQIFNMEGQGSNGQAGLTMALYGTSKNAVTYFTRCLIAENAAGPVQIGTLSPGIVLTDFTLSGAKRMAPERWAAVKRSFNIYADRVETVAPFLVAAMLATTKNGARIRWLTKGKAFWRRHSAKFRRRDLFADAA